MSAHFHRRGSSAASSRKRAVISSESTASALVFVRSAPARESLNAFSTESAIGLHPPTGCDGENLTTFRALLKLLDHESDEMVSRVDRQLFTGYCGRDGRLP